jgi:ferric-dicitrate binding protein FerR (iron transport regulator)
MKRWLETQPPVPWLAASAYALVTNRLAKPDPAAALHWLASLPGGAASARGHAGKEFYKEWLAEQPDEASQWARTMNEETFLREISAAERDPKAPPNGNAPKQQARACSVCRLLWPQTIGT